MLQNTTQILKILFSQYLITYDYLYNIGLVKNLSKNSELEMIENIDRFDLIKIQNFEIFAKYLSDIKLRNICKIPK